MKSITNSIVPYVIVMLYYTILQGLLAEEFPLASEALGVLSSRLVHDDKKSVDTACLALSRLADSYKHDQARLGEIAREDVLTNLQQLLVTQQVTHSISNNFNSNGQWLLVVGTCVILQDCELITYLPSLVPPGSVCCKAATAFKLRGETGFGPRSL